VAVLGLSGAGAAAAPTVPPGTTVCTSQIRADAGVTLSGSVTRNTSSALWKVTLASTTGGAETEVLRTPTGPVTYRLPATHVTPPVPGTYHFRGCVTVTGPLATTVQIQLTPIA
jgi:hypothetical protein